MKATNLAEWLLSRTTTPDHASAQLGDLLELRQTRGRFWFWRSILATVAYSSARPTLAFLAAFAASQLITQLWNHGVLGNRPDLNSVYTTGWLLLAPLTLIPIFSLIRFGWRDSITRYTFLFALPLAVATALLLTRFRNQFFYWTEPIVLIAALAFVRYAPRRSPALRSLAQLASAVAVNLSSVIAVLLIFLLCAAISSWLPFVHGPYLVMRAIGTHPLSDLLNAYICLLMIRASNRLRRPRGLSETA